MIVSDLIIDRFLSWNAQRCLDAGIDGLASSSSDAPAPARFKDGRRKMPWPSETNGPTKLLSFWTEAKFESDALGFGIELRKTGSKIHVAAPGRILGVRRPARLEEEAGAWA